MNLTSKPATDERISAIADGLGWPDRLHRRAIELAERTPDRDAWVRFLTRSALALGTVLVLAGIMDLVAFNWQDLGRFSRISLVAGLFVAACVAALVRGTEELQGKLAATSAAFLIGPLIGVIGQTYQTGADAWQLFAYWTVLSLPFLAATRWIPLLMMWTVLVDITLCTLHVQTWPGDTFGGFTYTAGALVVAHVAVVTICERFDLDAWFRRVQTVAAGGFAIAALVASVGIENVLGSWIAALLALVAVAAVQLRYFDPRRDPFAVAVSLLVAIFALNVPIIRLLVDANMDDWELVTLGIGFLILVESGAAMAWLSGFVSRHREHA